MGESTTPYDTVIIGAGLSGLAAGIRLAHYDKNVCIVERHTVVGGLNSFYRRKGRTIDVGLHAMTNFVPRDRKRAPLNKLLRQLRLGYDDLQLVPQHYSTIRFPDVELRFANGMGEIESEVERAFPGQLDGFRRLVAAVEAFDAFSLETRELSARRVLAEHLTDPVLTDMILCPLMYYGNPQAHDMDFAQFCIMFQSVFMEGFCRPRGGMRRVLGMLRDRFRSCGGELRLGNGVREMRVRDGRVREMVLDDGTVVKARSVLSCAGHVETMALCDSVPEMPDAPPPGWFSAVELIALLDCPARELGVSPSITFFSHTVPFDFRQPEAPVDTRSGVLCAPENFGDAEDGGEETGILRLTNIADHGYWLSLGRRGYREAKKRLEQDRLAALNEMVPGVADHAVFIDTFTPRTIRRFTSHVNGAIYGSPRKTRSGRTPVENLFICGTDQGFLGITGSMLSGVSIANAYLLR